MMKQPNLLIVDYGIRSVRIYGSKLLLAALCALSATQYVASAAKASGDNAPPTVPTSLAGSAPACNQVNLYWNVSTDLGTKAGGATYTSGLKGYNVYRGGVFLKQVLAPATSATDASVSGSTTYSYAVSAIDNAGNSSALSSPVYVTTPACLTCTVSLTTSSSPAAGGTASGGGIANCGSSVTVVAAANSGYNFVNWSENSTVVSSSSSYTFSANANRTLVANFSAASAGTLNGLWTFDTANVSGATAMDSSGNGNSATLTGTALPTIVAGKTNQAVNLDGVSGLVSVPDRANLNIRGAFTVAAWVNFNALPGSSRYPNIVAKLNSPSACYGYGIYWSGSGVSGIIGSGSPSWTSAGPGYTPAVGVWNHYVVIFDGVNLKLYVNGALYSQTAASAPGDTAGIPVKMGAHYSNPGTYGYVNGKLDDARIYSRALSSAEVTSLYNSAGSGTGGVVIGTSSSPAGAGSISGGGSYSSGSTVTVTATPTSCYTFVNWTENSSVVSSSASYTFTATANRNLVANFAQISYNITTSSSPSGAGTASGGGTKGCGSSVTVTATAYSGYSFANWTENGNVVSSSGSYSSTVNANRNLVANFTSTSCQLTASLTSPNSGATVSSTITLAATVSACATKVEFYCDNQTTPLGTATGSPFTASCNTTVMANGSHNFYARAYDAAGNWATSAGVIVTVNNSSTLAGQSKWAMRVGGTSVSDSADVTTLAYDQSGNMLVAARFIGTVNVGGQTVSNPSSSYGIVLSKYNGSGALIWVKNLASGNIARPTKVVADHNGDLVVCGYFQGTINFGGGAQTSAGYEDIFVAKYSGADGHWVWSKTFGGGYSDWANGVAVDSDNNVVVTGYFNGTASFGGTVLTSAGSTDIFLAKLSSATGGLLWAKRFGSTSYDRGYAIAAGANGETVVIGYFTGTVDFGGISRSSVSAQDLFVAKYDSSGSPRWVYAYGGTGVVYPKAVAVNSNGDIAVAGSLTGTAQFGGVALSSGSTPAILVAKYNSGGGHIWSRAFGGWDSSVDGANDVAMDSLGEVYVTGTVRDMIDLGTGVFLGTSPLTIDPFVAKYGSANGDCRWVNRYDSGIVGVGTDYDAGESLAVNENTSEVLVGGYYTGHIGFGPLAGTLNASSGGNLDGFLVKLQR